VYTLPLYSLFTYVLSTGILFVAWRKSNRNSVSCQLPDNSSAANASAQCGKYIGLLDGVLVQCSLTPTNWLIYWLTDWPHGTGSFFRSRQSLIWSGNGLLWNTKLYYCDCGNRIWFQPSSSHPIYVTYLNIVLTPTSRSAKWSLPLHAFLPSPINGYLKKKNVQLYLRRSR
jgi:hypothetical protein